MSTRAGQLYDFRGRRYITYPEVIDEINKITLGALAATVVTFSYDDMTVDGDDKVMEVDAIAVNVVCSRTGIIHSDMRYVVDNEGNFKTEIVFTDYADSDFTDSDTFTVMGLVKAGAPVEVPSSSSSGE